MNDIKIGKRENGGIKWHWKNWKNYGFGKLEFGILENREGERGKGENGEKASLPFLLLSPFAFLAVAVFGILQL